MSFLLSDFIELNNDELRTINGGGGTGAGAGSCGGGSSGGSSSGSSGNGSGGGSSSGNPGGNGSTRVTSGMNGGTPSGGGSSGGAGAGSCGGGSSGGSSGRSSGGTTSGYTGGNPGSGTTTGGNGNSGAGNGGNSGNNGNGFGGYGPGSDYNPAGSGNCGGNNGGPGSGNDLNDKKTDKASEIPGTAGSTSCSNGVDSGKSNSNEPLTKWEEFKKNNPNIPLPEKTLSELVPKDKNQSYEMIVDYTKNKADKMSVTVRVKNPDGTYDYSNGKVYTKTFNTTNKVNTEESIKFNNYIYKPNQFPDSPKEGWKVLGVKISDNKLMGPTIVTDAYTYVEGTYKGQDQTSIIRDDGYCDHGGINDTTWGCFKSSDADVVERINYILDTQESGGTVRYHVR